MNAVATKSVAVIPGDGIGKEVTREALKVLDALIAKQSLPISYQIYHDISGDGFLESGHVLDDAQFEELKEYGAIYLGAIGDPRVADPDYAKNVILKIRFGLDLYANIRPVKLYDPSFTPLEKKKPIDFTIIRENTEDMYLSIGGRLKPGTEDEVCVQEAIYTYKGVRRIIEFAFDYAVKHRRTRVTLVDKSNVLTHGHLLWQRLFHEIAPKYPGIQTDSLYVDNAAQQLVKRPWEFQVIVTTNMFGDILSDLAGEVVGGLGLAPSANIHPGKYAMFEPVHGSAPKYAGQDVANPMAAILTLGLMLEYFEFPKAVEALDAAFKKTIAAKVLPRDIGGSAKCSEVGSSIASFI
ncbi:MAG: isocitrate/isopropylmalate dehydrogenase family protein [bacterium]